MSNLFSEKELSDVLEKVKNRLDEDSTEQSVTISSNYNYDQVLKNTDSSDPGDMHGDGIKPDTKYWTKIPITEEEKAIYYGLHFHSLDNKFGLHTHIPGGELSGGHTHGPQNRMGAHHHRDVNLDPDPKIQDPPMIPIDGYHVHHTGQNMPSGPHNHVPGNFG